MTDPIQPGSPSPDPQQPHGVPQPPAPTTPPPPAWRHAGQAAGDAAPPPTPVPTPPADTTAVTQPVTWAPSMAAPEPAPSLAIPPAPAPAAPSYAQPAPPPPTYAPPAASYAPAAPAEPLAPVPASPARRGGVGVGALVTAVLATAVLTSGGTYLAVSAANRDDGTSPTAPAAQVATPPAGGQAPATAAPATPAPQTGQKSVVDIVKAVSPAVVTITAEGVSATDALGQSGTGTAKGSGVIFDSNGLILTNRHVVSGSPSKLTVSLKDGRTLDASIYGIDTLTDLAIVKVNETGLPAAPIGDSATIQVGQTAIAIGSPLGEFTDSVTSGIVSAIGRSISTEDGSTLSNLIQTDTAINPGNSGGPLLDPAGNVIGINTAIAGNAEGIGFAIPVNMAKPLLAQASAGQQLARAWLGVRFVTIDPTVKSENSLAADNGAWIPSPTALGGGSGSGETPAPSQGPDQGQGPDQNFGLTPDQLDQLFRQFGINPDDLQGQNPFGQGGIGQGQGGQGALSVEPIVAGSPADTAGLQAGDIITAVDGTALTQANPLDLVVSQLTPGRTITLDVLRDGQTLKLQLTLGTRPASV